MNTHSTVASSRDSNANPESFEKKYNDLKQTHHKLLEFIQEKEKENKTQQQTLKTKLEESKAQIRKLEDENLGLKYQLNASKEKEKQSTTQLQEMKVLLRKYYHKVQSNQSMSSQETDSPYIPYLKSKLGQQGLVVNTHLKETNLSNRIDVMDSPQTAGPLTTPSLNGELKLLETQSEELPRLEKQLTKGKSYYSQQQQKGINDSELSEPSIYNTTTSREGEFRRYFEETKSSSRDHKLHTVNFLPNDSPSKVLENMPKRRSQTLILDSSGLPRKVESLLQEGCKLKRLVWVFSFLDMRRFNMLSQNIVALDIKPEISKASFDKPNNKGGVSSLGDLDAPISKKPLLKYISKNPLLRKPTLNIPEKLDMKPEIKPRLFQDFFVIGASKQDIESFLQQNPGQNSGTLTPKILYSYPRPASSVNDPPQSSIPEFAFPFGVRLRKIKSSPSFSDLHSIIFKNNEYELKSKSFVFPLLSSNPIEDQPDLGEVIEKSNPNHLLYIVCIYFKDFVDLTNKTTQPKSFKDIKYFKTYKLMCFVTYYPFIDFFFETLTTLFRLLKVEREMKLGGAPKDSISKFENLDAEFTNHYLKAIIQKNLKGLRDIEAPYFSSPLNVKIEGLVDMPINYKIESPEKAWTLESIWACIPVFSYISLKDLLWIFSAFILEKKLVFLSKNIHLLTATLSVIRSLIKPFRYPFPLIFNLPEVLMALCDAPGAALIGINKGKEYLEVENLFKEYPSCIFVCLDEETVSMEKANKPVIPYFNNFEKSLLSHYAKLNVNLNSQIFEPGKLKVKPQRKSSLKFVGSEELKEKCVKILELFKVHIEEKIMAKIPAAAIYNSDNELDYPKIKKKVIKNASDGDKEFMKQFVETQIFIYYLEQHYQKK